MTRKPRPPEGAVRRVWRLAIRAGLPAAIAASSNVRLQRTPRQRRAGPLRLGVGAPRKARRILPGASPGVVRANHPPLPSVARLEERRCGRVLRRHVNERREAYTGNVIGRMGMQPLRAGIASKSRSGLVSVVTCVKPERTGRMGEPGESRRSSQATACDKRCVVNAGDPLGS